MFILWALLLFGILVLAHELGHFAVAKLTGVRVIRFSIGFGPKLIGVQFGETEYVISLIPLGGYVKLLAQEATEEVPCGVHSVAPGSPADQALMKPLDHLHKIGGTEVRDWVHAVEILEKTPQNPMDLVLIRENQVVSATLNRPDQVTHRTSKPDEFGRSRSVDLPELGLTLEDHRYDLAHAFFKQPLWVRFAIVLAGPLASIFFPVLIYLVYFLGISDLPSSQIGQVLADSPAAKAGLLPGDRITSIDGEPIRYWPDLAERIDQSPGETLEVAVQRENQTLTLHLTPESYMATSQIGDEVRKARIGIVASTARAFVGAVEGSPAALAGVKLGDLVTSVNGTKVRYGWELEKKLREIALKGEPIQLDLLRPKDGNEESGERLTVTITLTALSLPAGSARTEFDLSEIGLHSAELFVGKVDAGSPAETAGIREGDLLRAVNQKKASSWITLEQTLREKLDQPISLSLQRGSQVIETTVTQLKEVTKSEYGDELTRYRFGAWSALADGWVDGERLPIENRFSFALFASFETLYNITVMELQIFGKLFSGGVPMKALGGPIMIFDIAGKAAEQGWQQYLWIMALISINLGIFNLLPIPILDGGFLMFFTLEAISRRPVNQRVKEWALRVGFAMIICLMLLVFKNDIERYWDRIF